MGQIAEMVYHPFALLLLTPFAVIFIWAAVLEIRRWWRHGPSENQRNRFPIDETAPSYEPPEKRTAPKRPLPANPKTRSNR